MTPHITEEKRKIEGVLADKDLLFCKVLIIYDAPYSSPSYYSEWVNKGGRVIQTSYTNITREQAEKMPVKEEYTGDDALRVLWRMKYDRLDSKEKQICLAVYPKMLDKDPLTLKDPRDIATLAAKYIRRYFGITCKRCGGTGSYSESIRFTEMDNGVCYKCHGRGKQLPPLTNKKLAEIAAFFSEVAK